MFSLELRKVVRTIKVSILFSSVQLSHVWLFATPWMAGLQASLSITNSQSLLKLMSIGSVMPFIHSSTHSTSVVPFSSCLQSIPASGSFLMSQFFALGGQNIGVSASASVLPMNIQDWSPSEWAGWISLQFKGLSRVFYNTTVQKHQFFSLIFLYSPTLTSIHRIIFRIIKVISRRKHKPYRQYNTKGKISLQFLTLEKSCSLFAYDR